MDWDKEVKLEKCEDMITVYEKHIEELEKENKELKVQVDFLKEQLYYKSYGLPKVLYANCSFKKSTCALSCLFSSSSSSMCFS